MRFVRLPPHASAADARALVPPSPGVSEDVRAILEQVRDGGDDAVRSLTARFDHAEVAPETAAVAPAELEAAVGILAPDVLAALRTAIANVRAVAEAQVGGPLSVTLPEGQLVEIAEEPVRRAAAYVPAGRAPYPSTVVMCAVAASVAGVAEIVVCAPPGPDGRAHPTIAAACVLCGVTEVYRMGGAQAIAALAYGTAEVAPVDMIVGPGNRWVQEAKRQLVGVVGIDGVAGPSELAVVAGEGADPELVALDLLAQAEHGEDSLLAVISSDGALLNEVERGAERLQADRPSVTDARCAVVETSEARAAVRFADALAPEHLELVGGEVEQFADEVRAAGCIFLGSAGATAFGDYVAGSNHVLPTGGAARFQSALSPTTFRRRTARVSFPPEAPGRLAAAGAALARAEGFPVHAESMERRSEAAAPDRPSSR